MIAAFKIGSRGLSLSRLLSFLTASFALTTPAAENKPLSLPRIEAPSILRHIQTLSADAFEGRAPGSAGEEKTVEYLVKEFKSFGLKPGNTNGTFIQEVPLVGSTFSEVSLSAQSGDQTRNFNYPGQGVVWTKQSIPEVRLEKSEVVFVGYGISAPEYGWDDYKDVDVRGKTILMLVNDPPLPDPRDPTRLDDKMFKGRAMTYYGRWTYKFEIAAQKGAAAAIIVHETEPAGYPWMVVMGGSTLEHFDLPNPGARVKVEGWIPLEQAREVARMAGNNFDDLKKAALSREFKPMPMNLSFSYALNRATREIRSKNVLARLEGSDPLLKKEHVVYTAHWDHLGKNPKLEGDTIYNGARDNASGTATLLEIARAYSRLARPPRRSVLFLAVTAEEKGLLGAKYYVENPVYPLAGTLANLNMDSMNPWGRTRDVNVIGRGQSSLEELLEKAAGRVGRVLSSDAEPEKGRYYRSDHFEFAKAGVPGLYLQSGTEFIGKPSDFARQKFEQYVTQDYHKVSDEVKADWDLRGAAEDAQLLFEVGLEVSNGTLHPRWSEGSEFRKLRR